MGYYMELRNQVFTIKPENKLAALAAIKNLVGKETIQDSSGAHFSWVETNEFLNAKTLEEAIQAWNWNLDTDDDTGMVFGIDFEASKMGDETILFEAIAPFVEPGSYIEMQGEDGSLWRWVFNGNTCEEKQANVSWD